MMAEAVPMPAKHRRKEALIAEASGLLAASVGLKSKAKKRLDEITAELGE